VTVTAQLRVQNLRALLTAAQDAPLLAVERAAFVTKQVVVRALQADVGGEQRLSGARDAKVGVGYQMARTGAAQAVVRALGPWQLFNNQTARHLIIARALGTRSTARALTGQLGARTAFGGSGRSLFQGSQREFTGSKKAISEGRGIAAKKALTTPQGLRAFAFHPGTSGKRTWQRGVAAAEGEAVRELRSVAATAMQKAMKG
jgi:hypothetical protein